MICLQPIKPSRGTAELAALHSSLIRSSSFLFARILPPEVHRLASAGLRTTLAFLIFCPFMNKLRHSLANITKSLWWELPVGLIGGLLFFRIGLQSGEPLELAILSIGIPGLAAFAIHCRSGARANHFKKILLTGIAFVSDGVILLRHLIPPAGWPGLSSFKSLLIVLWLAGVNTAFSYFNYYYAHGFRTSLELNVMLKFFTLRDSCSGNPFPA